MTAAADCRVSVLQEEGGQWSAPLFVQLSELEEAAAEEEGEEGEGEVWREAARWIKYEEDVETEAGRWGRPHVAALELHALLELRERLAEGHVLLDARDVPDLVAAARALDPVPAAPAAPLLHALTRPHTHLLDDSLRLSLHRASRVSLQVCEVNIHTAPYITPPYFTGALCARQ